MSYLLTGADIHPGAEIGGGLRLTHTAGVVIGRGVRIGSNVTLLHGVTLGGSARGWFDGVYEDGYPDIGDETEIMAGAFVLGPIKVGGFSWLKFLVLINPLVYMCEGFRAALTTAPHMSLAVVYLVLAGFAALFLYLGINGFKKRVLS